ncbi:hypothetical protein ACT8ZV_17765 [Nocardioides sp. MAHUQ-72]|uniref:hypothetical protein n=1 Tax=unclassified Nocardioides TaxID=2615069 RepID=UPI0036141DE6
MTATFRRADLRVQRNTEWRTASADVLPMFVAEMRSAVPVHRDSQTGACAGGGLLDDREFAAPLRMASAPPGGRTRHSHLAELRPYVGIA